MPMHGFPALESPPGCSALRYCGKRGQTALHEAAWFGRWDKKRKFMEVLELEPSNHPQTISNLPKVGGLVTVSLCLVMPGHIASRSSYG